MSRYASQTAVSVDRSKTEIERTLDKYGATGFIYGTINNTSTIMFEMNRKRIRFNLPLPDKYESMRSPKGRERKLASAQKHHEQNMRQRWRALSLCIKAKLEAVESKITTFEEEFFSHIILPNGKTVGQNLLPHIETMYESGNVPQLSLMAGDDHG